MSITLESLVSELEDDVPVRDGVPTTDQYTRAVKDAVADFGWRAPLTKVETLAIVSGTAAYALPDDFLRIIRLTSLSSPEGVLYSAAGLVPVPRSFRERYIVNGGTITFYPTPTYTLERELWYAATYVLDSGEYLDLTDEAAQVAMMKARAIALLLQANKAAPRSYRAKLGDQEADKSRVAEALRAAAQEWTEQYEAAIKSHNGIIGSRG